jgi:hypothetical protein
MLLELVQQLCTAFPQPWELHSTNSIRQAESWYQKLTPAERLNLDLLPYAHTHRNHPCAVWTRATRANFDSTIELAQALAVEFRHRFGKPHGSEAALDWVVRHRAEAQVPDGPLQPFALAMPEEYQHQSGHMDALVQRIGDTLITQDIRHIPPHVAAYRAYYRAEKRGYWRKSRDPAKPSTWVPAKWTRRDPPEWF